MYISVSYATAAKNLCNNREMYISMSFAYSFTTLWSNVSLSSIHISLRWSSEVIKGREQIDTLILDSSKVFDVVPHCRIVNKLNYCGMQDNTMTWIRNWFAGHTQHLVVDRECSSESNMKSEVPRWMILYPQILNRILYSIYTKNTASRIRLFTDECILYRVICNATDAVELHDKLSRLCHWDKDWRRLFKHGQVFASVSHPQECFTKVPVEHSRQKPEICRPISRTRAR